MSFDLPANIERDLERYAEAEHISPAEAFVKLIQSGLKGKRRKVVKKTSLPTSKSSRSMRLTALSDCWKAGLKNRDRRAATILRMKRERLTVSV